MDRPNRSRDALRQIRSRNALRQIRTLMAALDEKGRYILIQELADLNRAAREDDEDPDDDRNPNNW